MHKFPDKHLQQALLQAAKVGHIKLMHELIANGANPFIADDTGRNAISYALLHDPNAVFSIICQLSSTENNNTS